MPYCFDCGSKLGDDMKCPKCGFELVAYFQIPAGRNTLVRFIAKKIIRREAAWQASRL